MVVRVLFIPWLFALSSSIITFSGSNPGMCLWFLRPYLILWGPLRYPEQSPPLKWPWVTPANPSGKAYLLTPRESAVLILGLPVLLPPTNVESEPWFAMTRYGAGAVLKLIKSWQRQVPFETLLLPMLQRSQLAQHHKERLRSLRNPFQVPALLLFSCVT